MPYIQGGCFNVKMLSCLHSNSHYKNKIDGLVQERCNSIANALELRLSCTNPSRWSHDCFTPIMGISVLGKTVFILKQVPAFHTRPHLSSVYRAMPAFLYQPSVASHVVLYSKELTLKRRKSIAAAIELHFFSFNSLTWSCQACMQFWSQDKIR